MTSQPSHLETRISSLKAVLSDQKHQQAVETAFKEANGDTTAALEKLVKKKLPKETLKNITLANTIADWSDDDMTLVTALTANPAVNSLRDIALNFNVEGLTALMAQQIVAQTARKSRDPEAQAATNDNEQQKFAVALRQKLFTAVPNFMTNPSLNYQPHHRQIPSTTNRPASG
jgi:hypothetical protein